MKIIDKEPEKELCSALVQAKVTPTLKNKIKQLAEKARRKEGDWLRLHLEDTIK